MSSSESKEYLEHPLGHMYALVTADGTVLGIGLGGHGSPPRLHQAVMGETKARGRAEDKQVFFKGFFFFL